MAAKPTRRLPLSFSPGNPGEFCSLLACFPGENDFRQIPGPAPDKKKRPQERGNEVDSRVSWYTSVNVWCESDQSIRPRQRSTFCVNPRGREGVGGGYIWRMSHLRRTNAATSCPVRKVVTMLTFGSRQTF